jgi:RNA polymerase sigma factor (sigma-70 family)
VDADTAIGGALDRFPETRYSLLEATAADGEIAAEALEAVAALYWKPVYKFIRYKFRKSNEDAKDLTQSFFASALERDFFQRFDPGLAAFRTYLRMAVERFAASSHAAAGREKRGGGVAFEPLEEGAADAATESPEEIFDREWRRQLFALAIGDLRAHAERTGKVAAFGVFEEYDLAEDARPSYKELAVRYGIAETAVTNHLAWARRMLRGFAAERLRGVTSGERELRHEMRQAWG